MEHQRYDQLTVSIADSLDDLAVAAAAEFAFAVNAAAESSDEVPVILATGNSQLRFVEKAVARDDIPWDRVVLFHMDEYRGMSADHPASFRRWMRQNVAEQVPLRAFYGVDGDHDPVEEELARYTRLLEEHPPAVTVMGIGENGHLAFNDPPADFTTSDRIHVVQLDEACRNQQVGEGHFPSLAETPTEALSLTVPMLVSPPTVMVVAPESRKAAAVKATLEGPITPDVPASILRRVPHAHLYLDPESAADLS